MRRIESASDIQQSTFGLPCSDGYLHEELTESLVEQSRSAPWDFDRP
jgi:hypothetical protein